MTNLNILYEDNHIIVVEKKPNVLCQSDNTKDLDLLTMLKDYIKEKYNKPGNVYLGLVHRLDRPVGGIMVFARTSKAASRLSEIIRNHEMQKEYLLVCEGNISYEGIMEDKIEKIDTRSIISNNGKYAKLEYRVIDSKSDKSLVNIKLLTGRKNQIRVQFAHINHPIVGDKKYGINDKSTRMYLHAYKLKLIHPISKKEICIEQDIPVDFKKICGINN